MILIYFLNLSENVCEEYEFKCNNYKCVHSSLKCNDIDDCGDNSDETENCLGKSVWYLFRKWYNPIGIYKTR